MFYSLTLLEQQKLEGAQIFRARAFAIGFGLGLGSAKFGFEPEVLLKFTIRT